MEDNKIDQVIESLSRIEASAVGVQQDAEKEKTEYARNIEEKIKRFDEQLDEQTQKELKELEDNLSSIHQKEVADMRNAILDEVAGIEASYNSKHEQWAKEIFEQIIKE